MRSILPRTADTRLGSMFAACRAQNRAAFIPYLVAGDPSREVSVACVEAAARGGADAIEIGIPYSDPLADGPTIQRASQRARTGGIDFDAALELAAQCSQRNPSVPLIAFTYYNPVYVRGVDRTAADFQAAGFAGVIVPDLPVDEAVVAGSAFTRQGLALSLLVAPTTPLERAKMIAARSSDFVYVVSRMGITGAGVRADDALGVRLAQLRTITGKPLAVGFGIDSTDTACVVARDADGVIVGSALIDRMEGAASGEEAVAAVLASCREFAAACRRNPSAASAKG